MDIKEWRLHQHLDRVNILCDFVEETMSYPWSETELESYERSQILESLTMLADDIEHQISVIHEKKKG